MSLVGGTFGMKRPFRVVRRERIDGLLWIAWEADFWEGPSEPGEVGRYITRRFRETHPSSGQSCSFWPELKKAFGL